MPALAGRARACKLAATAAMDLAEQHLPNVLRDMLERGHVVIEPFTAGEVPLPASVVEDDDDD